MRNQEGGRAATTRHNPRRCGLVATVFTAMAATGLAAPTPVVYGGGSHAHLLTSSTHRVGPLLSPPAGPGLVTTPEAHGAVGDGKANDWAPVQAALAACVEQPSCKVVFAKIYLSGPLVINASHVTLEVTGTLSMLAIADYPGDSTSAFITNGEGDPAKCATDARGYRTCLTDITITGGGTITSASSDAWWARKVLGGFRPHLMSFDSVLRLTVDNIHTTNAPNHNIEISSSVAVRVRRFTATEPNVSPNTDGINFYGGFDQLLEDSTISSGDDCVSVVPNGLDRQELCAVHPLLLECSGGNVVVRNTSCLGGHGISIGGVRHGSVSNVTFENMTATGGTGINTQGEYSTGGLRIKSYPNSTGLISDITYRNINLVGVYLPIQLLARYCPAPCRVPDGNTSVQFQNIKFENITGTAAQLLSSEVAVFSCSQYAPCRNISLVHVKLYSESIHSSGGSVRCDYAPGVTFDNTSVTTGNRPLKCDGAATGKT